LCYLPPKNYVLKPFQKKRLKELSLLYGIDNNMPRTKSAKAPTREQIIGWTIENLEHLHEAINKMLPYVDDKVCTYVDLYFKTLNAMNMTEETIRELSNLPESEIGMAGQRITNLYHEILEQLTELE